MNSSVIELPFNKFMGIERATEETQLLRHFGRVEGVLPVVRRLEAKFGKPADGALTSTNRGTPKAEMLDAFRKAGREPEYDEKGIFGRGFILHGRPAREHALARWTARVGGRPCRGREFEGPRGFPSPAPLFVPLPFRVAPLE